MYNYLQCLIVLVYAIAITAAVCLNTLAIDFYTPKVYSSASSGDNSSYHSISRLGGYGNMLFDSICKNAHAHSDTSKDSGEFGDRLNALMPTDKNYMFSPLSIKTAFAMAANGADGNTKKQLLSALGIDDLDSYNESSKKLDEKYSDCDFLCLEMANSIWRNTNHSPYAFSSVFADKIADFYGGTAEDVTNENATGKINGWVKQKTHGKITDIIDNPDFSHCLVNSVYFKGTWQDEFSKGATKKEVFTSRDGKTASIDFMHRIDYMSYCKNEGTVLVELPYSSVSQAVSRDADDIKYTDLDLSMYGIMSEGRVQNPVSFIKEAKPESTYVSLGLPKFRTEFMTSLNKIMQALGATDAFNPKSADFSQMLDGGGNAYIDEAIHKSYIDVDEEGTEACAVTALFVKATAAPKKPVPIEVKFDKPFTYAIYDNLNDVALFIGEYAFAQ